MQEPLIQKILTEKEIIKKTSIALSNVFKRMVIKEPYYTMLRELQQDIYRLENKKETASNLRKRGKSIRQIAKEMGYKHPGSVSHLLK